MYRNGQFPGMTTFGNQTALHVAAAEGRITTVKWLLAREADPLAEDLNGRTPADFAARQGQEETRALLEAYVQLRSAQEDAFADGEFAELEALLTGGYRNYALIHAFAQNGLMDELKAEIEAGADVNARTATDVTPLHKAVITDQLEAARLLLENGANVDAVDHWNNSPLYYAVLRDNPNMVGLLAEFDAGTTIRSAIGNESIMEYAERKGNQEILDLLADQ